MGMFQLGWLRELIATPDAARTPAPRGPVAMADFAGGPVLLAFATQTGVAEDMANATREQLWSAGVAAQLVEFDALTLPMLEQARQALFLASTTCDGDPPDMAEDFARATMAQPASLGQLHYGLLALGDSAYGDFCGFGRQLDAWLLASGAQACFPRIEVDDENAAALDRWHRQVAALVAAPHAAR